MTRLSLIVLLILCNPTAVFAESPVGWRSDASGRYPDVTPPTRWSQQENVVWKTEMPGKSFGSPVVFGDKVFVVSDPDELLCVAANDGKVLWRRANSARESIGPDRAKEMLDHWNSLNERKKVLQKQFNELRKAKPDAKTEHGKLRDKLNAIEKEVGETRRSNPVPGNRGSGNTAATPICDGRYVYTVFGSGIVAAYDMNGERQWIKFVEGTTLGFGHGSSPVLIDRRLIVHFHDLVALEADTGEIVWRTELRARHATSIAVRLGTTAAIVSPSGNFVRVSDGTILTTDKALEVSEGSPIVDNGVLYAQSGKTTAFRLPTDGNATELESLWQTNSSRGRRTPSPVVHDGLLYGVTTNGILEVLDAQTGDVAYRKRLDIGNFYSSITAAGDYIYLTSTKGVTIVLDAGREYREIENNQLESIGSNPVFVGKRLYLRGHKHLYCIGE